VARVLVLAVVFSLVGPFGTPAQADTPPARYIVVYRDGVEARTVSSAITSDR
jgi:hypothetical protein